MTDTREIRIRVSERVGDVAALVLEPPDARFMLVFGHGAGAGMRHPFMEAVARALAEHGVGTFRYQFPYMEAGRKPPNPARVLIETVRCAVREARETTDTPLIAGGKSMGGRMTSQAASQEPLEGVRGLVFFGFPLHAPGKKGDERAAHLFEVDVPMLFLQGTRDRLADLALLGPICARLGERCTLHVVDGADHSFRVPKKSGRTDVDVFDELARAVDAWTAAL